MVYKLLACAAFSIDDPMLERQFSPVRATQEVCYLRRPYGGLSVSLCSNHRAYALGYLCATPFGGL
jgi:hypothetical protein